MIQSDLDDAKNKKYKVERAATIAIKDLLTDIERPNSYPRYNENSPDKKR